MSKQQIPASSLHIFRLVVGMVIQGKFYYVVTGRDEAQISSDLLGQMHFAAT